MGQSGKTLFCGTPSTLILLPCLWRLTAMFLPRVQPYDSGFGSNLSASTRSSSSLAGTTTAELPPPPPYHRLRGQHQPRLRGARLHRSYSDSRRCAADLGATPRSWCPAGPSAPTHAAAPTSCRSSWAAASRVSPRVCVCFLKDNV